MSNNAGLTRDPPAPMSVRIWRRLPTVVRGVVVGYLVLVVGQSAPGILLLANLKLSPTIPWFLPATAVWLWLFWRYLNGEGWPLATAQSRRRDLRGGPVPAGVWRWSLLAGALGMVSVMGLAFVTTRLANVSQEALNPPFAISAYPLWTVISIFLQVAAVAGVVEEAAFRGYMLSPIQRRHGWIAAIGIVGLMFFVSHLSHAYASIVFLPFFLAYSVLHGLLVYLTRSILPSIVLHALSDFAVVPVQYGMMGSQLDFSVRTYVALTLIFGVAAVPAFYRLATVTRDRNRSAPR